MIVENEGGKPEMSISTRSKNILKKSLVALSMIAPFAIAGPALAEPDFAGKDITFWTSHKGADSVLSLQTFSNYISKYLKGNPKITVVSKFGGGGLVNANYFAKINKPDGLNVTMFNFVVTMAWAMGKDGVNYELDQYRMVGAEPQVFMHMAGTSAKVGDSMLDIAKAGPHTYGTRTRNANVMAAEMLFKGAGNPLKVVTGFGKTEDVIQALASGEVQLSYVYGPAWVRNEANYRGMGLKPLAQMGVIGKNGEVARYAPLANIPTVAELYLKTNPNGKKTMEYLAMKTATGLSNIGKGYFIGKDTPDDIVDAWRAAMQKAAADPDFIKEHTKLLGTPLELVPGPEAESILKDGLEVLKDTYFQKGNDGYKMVFGGK